VTPDGIDAIGQAIPGAVQPGQLPDDWLGDLVPVPDTDPLVREVEDELFGDDIGSHGDGWGLPPRGTLQEGDMDESINRDSPPDVYGETISIADRIARRTGDQFPGAPGRRGASKSGLRPPPSVFAFYLPWHDFFPSVWGIYLIEQGIRALGADIHSITRGGLTLGEARRVAKMFLFHHEAYHNITETFAVRLEVSHRKFCYRGGFRSIWAGGFGAGMHEEGLANAYAYQKVKSKAFEDVLSKGPLRDYKRRLAAAAIAEIIRTSPPPYHTAMPIIRGNIAWDDAEHEFQEANHAACLFGVARLAPEIWLASGHAMHPSLARNRKYSYLIDRNHSALRSAATVPHFSRLEVVRRLKVALNVTEVPGERHPSIVLRGGRRVPVPGHRELSRDTTRRILKEVDFSLPLTRFMSASDDELRALCPVA
jgi:hypothetical protein